MGVFIWHFYFLLFALKDTSSFQKIIKYSSTKAKESYQVDYFMHTNLLKWDRYGE